MKSDEEILKTPIIDLDKKERIRRKKLMANKGVPLIIVDPEDE